MENHIFEWVNQLEIAIFNSYVNLPEDIMIFGYSKVRPCRISHGRMAGDKESYMLRVTDNHSR